MFMSSWNQIWFRAINDLGKEYTYLNPIFIFLAEYMVYVFAFCLVVIWFSRREKNRMMVIQAGFAFIVAEILGKVAGLLHSNSQPFAELQHVNQLIEKAVDNSFPSDHTILFFSICFTFWLVQRRSGLIWMLLAISVAISRIWVGVHYPFDVLAGAAIGVISAYIAYLVVPRLHFIRKTLAIYERVEEKIIPTKHHSRNL
ncbi:undecaprenyl-diphosphatase [Cytobacillus sp. Hz8]|uniref:undecaprenyl-diphosphatase n=1 Tax=Cytobacillus sp. Hz8 TaxID=3347168 RepID=UPI0035E1C878